MTHTMHPSDLTGELKHDHRAIQTVFDRIDCAAEADRERLVCHAAAEFERHAVAERRFLLPVVRCEMRGGDVLAGRVEDEYAEVMRALYPAVSASVRDAGFDERVQALASAFKRHVWYCESWLFPEVCRVCSAGELARLGEDFRRHAHRHQADIA
ncbi:hemerythrin HHE cation binding domain-containing protein [Streptomyces noursei ATCC 11455]|uniref:hemerythrin domain-containing protein n=1 Tax=Streptomyces noursei TaxID=1971 RepID=UPI00081C57D5|nr:hemerythrin HHE cation binding domain-containing protein [Streptomyces noursei ATCC 11455]